MKSTALLMLTMFVALFGASGCGDGCTDEARAGLRVVVTDAADDERVCDAEVTAFDGNFSELLFAYGSPNCSYQGAFERVGTYKITVTHPDYAEANSEPIEVLSDGCHVELQDIALSLEAP